MPNIVKILWSKVLGNVPSLLVDGQIAINQRDRRLFYPDGNGVIQSYSLVESAIVFTSVDFGGKPINERIFNIINPLCTINSNIEISQVFKTQTEENFGVRLELFIECFNGNFNIIAVSSEPFSRGIFNLKYIIL